MLINTSRSFPFFGAFCRVVLLGNRWRCAFVVQSLNVPHTRQILWSVEAMAGIGVSHCDPNRQSGQIYGHIETLMVSLTPNTIFLSFLATHTHRHTHTCARTYTHAYTYTMKTRAQISKYICTKQYNYNPKLFYVVALRRSRKLFSAKFWIVFLT